MSPEQARFMSLAAHPARLSAEEAAWLLGFCPHDMPILVSCKLLTPLGAPAGNGQKHFALEEIQEKRADRRWLSRATQAVQQHWRKRNHPQNARRGDKRLDPETHADNP